MFTTFYAWYWDSFNCMVTYGMNWFPLELVGNGIACLWLSSQPSCYIYSVQKYSLRIVCEVMSHNYILEQSHIAYLLDLQLFRPVSACHSNAADAVLVRRWYCSDITACNRYFVLWADMANSFICFDSKYSFINYFSVTRTTASLCPLYILE